MSKVGFSDKVREHVKSIKVLDLIKSGCEELTKVENFTEKDTLLAATIIKLEDYLLTHGEI